MEKRLTCDISAEGEILEETFNLTPPTVFELRKQKLNELKAANGPTVVYIKAPAFKQANVGMGSIYTPAEETAIRNWVIACKAVIDEKEAALIAAATITALGAVDISVAALEAEATTKINTM